MATTFKEKWGIDKLPTLYHGTDLRYVIMPDEIRKNYQAYCHVLIEALKGLYNPFIHREYDHQMDFISEEQKKQNPQLVHRIQEAMNNLFAMQFSEEWEYGDFYLTSNKHIACMYAYKSFAGGELGFTAYHLLKGAEFLGVDFTQSEKQDEPIKFFKKMAEGQPKPAIFSFDDLSLEHLQPAFGGSLQSYIKDGRIGVQEFRYTRPVTLDPAKAELIDPDIKKSRGQDT